MSYSTEICPPQLFAYCKAEGYFDYDKDTVTLISMYIGDDAVPSVDLYVLDLKDNLNVITNKKLETFATLSKIDEYNMLIMVPATANLNSHVKVFNLPT